MTPDNTANIVITQLTSSAIVVYIMQKLKSASWFPFLQHGQAMVSRIVSIALAGVTAIGINYSWNPQTRGLLITIPTLTGLVAGLWHWGSQYATNEILYQATVNKISVTHAPVQGPVVPAMVAPSGAVVVPEASNDK